MNETLTQSQRSPTRSPQILEQDLGRLMDAYDACVDTNFAAQSVAAFGARRDQLTAGALAAEEQAFVADIDREVEEGAEAARRGTLPAKTSVPLATDSAADIDLDHLFDSVPNASLEALLAEPNLAAQRGSGWAQLVLEKIFAAIPRIREREKALLAEQGARLPARNAALRLPGYVEPCEEMGGLIHGGVVTKPGYVLICRAFRFFDWNRRKINATNPGDVEIDVVAGVCEQRSRDGRLLATWSTAPRLQARFADASLALPDFAVRTERLSDGRFRQSGYYLPFAHILDIIEQVMNNKKAAWSRPVSTADSGLPTYTSYKPSAKHSVSTHPFKRAPSYEDAIENALFSRATRPSQRFPINTPYLKVYSPAPESPTTIVAMAGAHRSWRKVGKREIKYEREDTWQVRTFR